MIFLSTIDLIFKIKVKSWSNLQKRTEILLKDLAKENCDGGKKLKKIW